MWTNPLFLAQIRPNYFWHYFLIDILEQNVPEISGLKQIQDIGRSGCKARKKNGSYHIHMQTKKYILKGNLFAKLQTLNLSLFSLFNWCDHCIRLVD